VSEDKVGEMLWVNVMNIIRKGIFGLIHYDPDTKEWSTDQPHVQAAFVILMWIYKQ